MSNLPWGIITSDDASPRPTNRGFRRVDGDAPAGRMTLRTLGADHPFATTARQAYALQGPRDLLSRFTNARPEQMITILAEPRPGGGNLFILTLDLCPAK